MDNELLQLAIDLREGFYVLDDMDNLDDDSTIEITYIEAMHRILKAHHAADRLTQIERERAWQITIKDNIND